MESLLAEANAVGERLKARKDTVAVAESSAGGLVSAALLAQPGASAYFRGGAVVYTIQAREAFAGITPSDMEGKRAATEEYALMLARALRRRLGTTWALAETGASGPTGNRYGDPAGHTCLAVVGPVEIARTLETGSAERTANMRAFAAAALGLLAEAVG